MFALLNFWCKIAPRKKCTFCTQNSEMFILFLHHCDKNNAKNPASGFLIFLQTRDPGLWKLDFHETGFELVRSWDCLKYKILVHTLLQIRNRKIFFFGFGIVERYGPGLYPRPQNCTKMASRSGSNTDNTFQTLDKPGTIATTEKSQLPITPEELSSL